MLTGKSIPQAGQLGRLLRRSVAAAALFGTALGLAPSLLWAGQPSPFVISVDGVTVDGSGIVTDERRKTDVGLAAVDIEVKFDGLGVTPVLNVSTAPIRSAYAAGETVTFLTSFNYPAFVARRELRIYKHGDVAKGEPYARLDVAPPGLAVWRMPADAPPEMDYVFRVYDAEGRYDETVPLTLIRSERDLKPHQPVDAAVAPGYGEDRTAIRNIVVNGGAVTVYGKNVPAGHRVTVFDEPVPVDISNAFVVQRILPAGTRNVAVTVLNGGKGIAFNRDIDIPKNDWFYVALADLTAGYRTGSKHIEDVKPGEYDSIYTRGRLAFYVKGKIKGKYLLTAAGDTGDGKIEDLFKGLDAKDPRQFLKRIDPNDYYPVYGDDSSVVEDAPTRGKFYVRLENGPSHVMWGNFRSNITGTQFLRGNRALYGASGVYRSEKVTPGGEARSAADVYAAQPGTLPQHDIFRATGGSAYFLKQQDITSGSETVTVETRNTVTGWVIARRTLKADDDYEFDYVQGVLLLKYPLPSSSTAGTGNFIVADYEFTPASGNTSSYVTGGRAQQWLGDHLRTGVTGMTEKTGAADQKLYGADLRLQAAPDTWIEGEIARSKGPGFGSSYSADGGLTIQDTDSAGQTNRQANAYRAEAHAGLDGLTKGKLKGNLGARYEAYGKGFSSLDQEVTDSKQSWGVDGDVEFGARSKATATYSEERTGKGGVDRDGRAKVKVGITDHVSLEPFGRYSEKRRTTATGDDTGRRGDAGLRGTYAWDEHTEAWVFGQATVSRSGSRHADNRAGVGGKRMLTEKIDASGEVSYGSLGVDATATLGYNPTADDRYYIGYRLDAERQSSTSWPYELTGSDLGSIVSGARHRFNDQWSVYGEDNFDMFGARQSLTQAYGVTYTPDARWTIGGGLEMGRVYDNTTDPVSDLKNPDFDRRAASLSTAYRDEDGWSGKAKAEARFDNSEDDKRDVDAYLLSAALGVKMSEDWRTLAALDAVFTNATDSTRDGEYVEGSLGFAYRAAASDRFNALVKYTYLYDLPGDDQVTVDGTTNGPAQRSHIFSADASYDLNNRLTLGAKYGIRIGDTRDRALGSDWESSTTELGILRADLHIVHAWDALVEARVLWSPDGKTRDFGALAAIYRQLGDNMKIGAGYNFGIFSDDLRDLVHDDRGVFINVIGKL